MMGKEHEMTRAAVEERIDASADTVWNLVQDFGGIMSWSNGAFHGLSVEGDGIGAIRTINVTSELQVQEQLKAHDDQGKQFTYAIIGDSPLPMRDYLATMKIVPIDDSSCTVDWSATFEPDVEAEKAIAIVEGIYNNGIAGIKKALSS